MLTRLWPVMLLVFALLAPSTLRAQVVEEDDTEILKPVPLGKAPPKSPSIPEAVLRIIALTNEFREQEKQERVEINPQLQKAPQYFSGFMARTNRYGHKADGATPADRAKKFGYEYCIVAENIGYAYSSAGFTTEELAQEFFEGWKASPGHRRNMLDPDVKQIFINAGIMHIMAVSGLHAVILSLFIFKLLFFLKGKFNIIRILVTIIILWAFAFVTGLSPSVLRAVLMCTFLQRGNLMNR